MEGTKVSSQELVDLEEQLKVRKKEEIDPILQVGLATDQQLTIWKNDLNFFADDFDKIRERMEVEFKNINSMDEGDEKQVKVKEYNQRGEQFNRCLYTYYIPLKEDVYNEINTRKDQQEEKEQAIESSSKLAKLSHKM